MNLTKVLVFDVSGEYAHFRKFNTTSSPLTFNLPTRPAIAGLLGAILGIEREVSPNIYTAGTIPVNELFHPDKCIMSVQILNRTKKTQIGFNLLDTSKQGSSFFNIKNRTQIEFEFLKDAAFRIYLQHKDENLMQELTERIENRRHHFTPYLGLAQLTADIQFVGIQECVKTAAVEEYSLISSAVNLATIKSETPVKFESHGTYVVDTLPVVMLRNREVTVYSEILSECSGKDGPGLLIACSEYYCIDNKVNILFL